MKDMIKMSCHQSLTISVLNVSCNFSINMYKQWLIWWPFNTLRSRQYGRHFAADIFKCIFLNENVSIAIKISLKFVPKGPIYNIPALVQIMAWRRPGDKPLSEPMMVSLPTHLCVTRSLWGLYDFEAGRGMPVSVKRARHLFKQWLVAIRRQDII